MPLTTMTAPVSFSQIQVGQVYTASECFGGREMDQFAGLSGDHSPIHSNENTAKQLGFQGRLQYGFLLTTLLSRIVGTNFFHAVCAALTIDFVKPCIAGARVDVRAEVTHIQEAMRSVVLKFTMVTDDDMVARGKLTTVFLPDRQAESLPIGSERIK